MRLPASLMAVALALAVAADAAAADAAHGQELYESRCGGCHSLDANRVGPAHRGVYGRKAGSAPNFNYSPAVKNSTVVWEEKTLDAWLTNPQALIPGSAELPRPPRRGPRTQHITCPHTHGQKKRRINRRQSPRNKRAGEGDPILVGAPAAFRRTRRRSGRR